METSEENIERLIPELRTIIPHLLWQREEVAQEQFPMERPLADRHLENMGL